VKENLEIKLKIILICSIKKHILNKVRNLRGDIIMYLSGVKGELKEYFNILCDNDYPEFINKYIELDEMQRLKGIDQFCGCYYTKIFKNKYWYSRLDHSIATSLMTWHFTKDKTQTLSALFHDLGTPSFSHCVDFLMGDSIKQESSEKDVMSIIRNSKKINEYLKIDGIDVNDLDTQKYGVVENDHPSICVDRLDGVFGTCLIWNNYFGIEDIREIYKDMTVLINEKGNEELGFSKLSSALKFFNGSMFYAYILQRCEDKYVMNFISSILDKLIKTRELSYEDLYVLTEDEIIKIINNTNCSVWNKFTNSKEVNRLNKKLYNLYIVSGEVKKRFVIPLVMHNDKISRINDISSECNDRIVEFMEYKDSKYCYVESIYDKELYMNNRLLKTRKRIV